MKSIFLVLLAAGSLALFAACGDSGEGGKLEATLTEFEITLDKDSLPKGPIEFSINNEGERKHEFIIVKTDIAPEDLPTNDDGSFDDGAPDVDVVREIEDIEDGDEANRTYELDPGKYAFICNRVEDIDGVETSHYAEGMYAGFTVTEDNGDDDDDTSPSETDDGASPTSS